MHFPHTVTFTLPVEDRTPAGGVTYDTWADVSGLTDIPCRIVPEQSDDHTERMVFDTERFVIVAKGDLEVDVTMRAESDFLDSQLGVIKVERPVLYRSWRTNCTLVTVEKIRATAEAADS